MAFLPENEIRRLLKHVHPQIQESEQFAMIEDELRGEDAEEFLREPDILAYFPAFFEILIHFETTWQLKVIPHAHLRMVQRGVTRTNIVEMFQRFLDQSQVDGFPLLPGPYAITGHIEKKLPPITLRLDIDTVIESTGTGHVVTIIVGRSESGLSNVIEI